MRTRETLPLEWAATHDNLGTAYRLRVDGDTAAQYAVEVLYAASLLRSSKAVELALAPAG